ncbi:[LSU ribosomal protein L11P]-lysine N-methyltransferase [Nitrosococcus oceani ATCC 19707]|uniref:Ribosomal protein L11 methyltransferase n=2 Tax=Nitrosococcus oceani TaxID=1229 RepID=PRMA_NITOC|nr:50S ribosomal protein L11 methyltransferase [Nitrosococcus oceani]Q3JC88.1 RecName: Full=Ribosomal protein L11 methyltransferase; Short=L11 Mtase [Nitrosococcus oceani ATCC 19707]KFI20058.1 ribosomal protein L11 methyltransferase [Nitrosococcus oceani C-27]ABA57558.1 [LSU ribosomal protein L11P]-lysine N-methyltransferase [Nitrosococcus oceani ATCC 19707]EDZ67006.1 ribosomal protein L11 methyltransferase [Nitrosococcus oceani AFC27]GEM20653.1 50S ribosomal protein L11 methyltransferase [Nit
MPWIQFQLEVSAGQVERLSDQLSEAGAVAVTLLDATDQPLFEPPPGETPLWSRTRVNALFPMASDPDTLLQELKQDWAPESFPSYRWEILADQNWERAWMDHFKPLRFGSQLWVCPSWLPPPEPEAVNLLLDPGLAFGTGTHPTTALCLEWLTNANLNQACIIDYGCGSGILAIAALKLGATAAVAVDHDPQALLATQENATHNGVISQLQVSSPSELIEIKADFLVANILAEPLLRLASLFARLTYPGAYLILSGITSDQIQQILQTYNNWFTFNTPMIKENWVLLAGHRR